MQSELFLKLVVMYERNSYRMNEQTSLKREGSVLNKLTINFKSFQLCRAIS